MWRTKKMRTRPGRKTILRFYRNPLFWDSPSVIFTVFLFLFFNEDLSQFLEFKYSVYWAEKFLLRRANFAVLSKYVALIILFSELWFSSFTVNVSLFFSYYFIMYFYWNLIFRSSNFTVWIYDFILIFAEFLLVF